MKLNGKNIINSYLGSKQSNIYLGSKSVFANLLNGIPANLLLVVNSDSSITGSFDSTSTNQDGYYVYISTDGVNYNKTSVTWNSERNFTKTGLTANTLYYFYVTAYRGIRESDPSNTANKTTYTTEAITYKTMVEADLATIEDLTLVNQKYVDLLSDNSFAKLKICASPSYGVKYINGKISKLYNLTLSNHVVQTNEDKMASVRVNEQYGGKKTLSLTGVESYYIENMTLPTRIDGWCVMNSTSSNTQMICEHSATATANNGFFWAACGARLNFRRTATHYINKTDKWVGNEPGIASFYYSATEIVTKLNNVDAVNTPVVGAAVNESNVTTQLNLFARNNGSLNFIGDVAEIMIFSTLTPTQRTNVYNSLNSTYRLFDMETISTYNFNQTVELATGIRSPFSKIDFTYSGTRLAITANPTNYSAFPQYSNIVVFVNGVYNQKVDFASHSEVSITLPYGENKHISLVESVVSKPSSTYIGCWITALKKQVNCTATMYADTVPSKRRVYLGDSITAGANATIPQKDSFVRLAAINNSENNVDYAFGYAGLIHFGGTLANAQATAAKIATLLTGATTKELIILLGTNDAAIYGTDATTFTSRYGRLVDCIVTAVPTIRILCVSPLWRSAWSQLLQDYSDGIEGLCPSRSNTVFMDGYELLTSDKFDIDGVHPINSGHTILASDFNITI